MVVGEGLVHFPLKITGKRFCVGVDEYFVGVEAQPFFRDERAIGTPCVEGSRADSVNVHVPDIPRLVLDRVEVKIKYGCCVVGSCIEAEADTGGVA